MPPYEHLYLQSQKQITSVHSALTSYFNATNILSGNPEQPPQWGETYNQGKGAHVLMGWNKPGWSKVSKEMVPILSSKTYKYMLSNLPVRYDLHKPTTDQLAGNYGHKKGNAVIAPGRALIPYLCKHEEICL